LDIKRFRHFLAVIDSGSISDAARALRMSQGALSISIQAIERDAGSPLFIRSSDGMTLNEVGRALETRARLITNEVDRAQQEIRELLGMERGRVAIGTTPHFAGLILPRAIIQFQEAHPRVQVNVFGGHLSTLIAAAKSRDIDFALATLSRNITADPELGSRVLVPNRSSRIYAAATNPLSGRRQVSPETLASCPWLLPRRSDYYRAKLARVFENVGLQAPDPAVEYDSPLMARQLLCEGPYIAFFSRAAVHHEITHGMVKPVHAPSLRWDSDYPTGAFFRNGGALSPAALKLLSIVGTMTREVDG